MLLIFTLSTDELDRKMNFGKYIRRWCCLSHLPTALEDLTNWMQEISIYFNAKFSVEKFKKRR